MRSIANIALNLTAPLRTETCKIWPVWRDSVRNFVKFEPIPRKLAGKLWHKARRWDQRTHRHGKHGGIIGASALTVFYVLTHDFLNYASGRLDPSIAAIAHAASLAESTVYLALKRLKLLGLLNWTRRCREDRDETGQFRLRQDTNAYRVLPHSEWLGYRDDAAPPPTKDTLGYPEPVSSPIESAASMVKAQQPASVYRELTLDPKNELALALASFGRAAGFI
jgi:hypothetical protein